MARLIATIAICLLSAAPALAQNAADAYYDPAQMANARTALNGSHGNQINSLIVGERLEYQSNGGAPLVVWEAQGWIGRDIQKLWFKTDGEYETEGSRFREAEVQVLYSRAIRPFWELQAGVRHDIKPNPSRTYGVISVQGLAPYWFEVDGALFLSGDGDFSARLEAEYEFRLTQRLMLQPRIEINSAFSNDAAIGVGSGLSTAEAGLRLRYAIRREFAPYIGVSWNQAYGSTKYFKQSAGEDAGEVSWVAGVRFWF